MSVNRWVFCRKVAVPDSCSGNSGLTNFFPSSSENRSYEVSLENKLLVHKAILKPVWTYGVQLWGLASKCNIEILERLQSKVLRIITDAPWYVPIAVICDVHVLSVKQEVRNYSVTYRQRLNDHPNSLAKSLFQRPNYNPRLKRYYPADLAIRFNWYSATPPQTITNHLWLPFNNRCITGRISYMPLIVTVSTIVECLRTDCNIWEIQLKKKSIWVLILIYCELRSAVGQNAF